MGIIGTLPLEHFSLRLYTNILNERAQSLSPNTGPQPTSPRRTWRAANLAGTMLMPLRLLNILFWYGEKKKRLPQAMVGKAPSVPCMGWGYCPSDCGQSGSSSLTACGDLSRAQSHTAFTASPAQIPGSCPSCQLASPPQKAAPCLSWMTSCQTRAFHSMALLCCWRANFLLFDPNLPVVSLSA